MRLTRTFVTAACLLLHWGFGHAQGVPVLRPGLLAGCPLPAPALFEKSAPFRIEVDLTLRATGVVDAVQLLKSSGSEAIDHAFLAAASQCRFVAVRGDAAKYELRHTLRFGLERNPLPLTGAYRCFPVPYPALARRLGEQGTSEVSFEIQGDDAPNVVLRRSSGSERLDRHAVNLVSSCVSNSSVLAELDRGKRYSQAITFKLEE
jgi:TonB family protein